MESILRVVAPFDSKLAVPFLRKLFAVVDSPLAGHLKACLSDIDINVQDFQGRTPLMAAWKGKHADTVRFFTERLDVQVDLRDNRARDLGWTPFLHAVKQLSIMYYEEGGLWLEPILAPLLDRDPHLIEQCDDQGRTALILAAGGNSTQLIDFLVSRAVSLHPGPTRVLNAQDGNGRSALMYSLDGRPVKNYQHLLACPLVDIHVTDCVGLDILGVVCSISWRNLLIFGILDALLDAEGGWEASSIRKAVISGVRHFKDIFVYRLLLEDWVIYSFDWDLDDVDTVALLVEASSRRSGCRVALNILFYHLGLIEPSLLAEDMQALDHERIVETLCGKEHGCWHSESRGGWGKLPHVFKMRRSYSLAQLEQRIRKPALCSSLYGDEVHFLPV
ncbi:hypothetical protein NMY22_g10472 [Coprinellus aureogranulatus]|nr:hypothetical protein NMY22_g10472 [Coprinellus aureogranulatus]